MVEPAERVDRMTGVLGRLSSSHLAALWAILTVALVLRVVGLGWGLPPTDPQLAAAGIRSSYSFDEDNAIQAIARTNPAAFDFDPKHYVWGTLHLELLLATLEASDAGGWFDQPWRTAWSRMAPRDFERIYIAGRALSVALDLGTVFVVFLLGAGLGGPSAGLWAAALLAVSPGHALQATQIRVDVSATLLTALTALLALRGRGPGAVGLMAGLAAAAKYSTAPTTLVFCAAAWLRGPRDLKGASWLIAGVAAGFLVGQPFLLTNTEQVLRQVGRLIALSREIPPELLLAKPLLLLQSLIDLARFSIGWPAAIAAALGFWSLGRGTGAGRALPWAFAVAMLSVLPQNWPLMRYYLPAVPLCAVAAGVWLAQRSGSSSARPWALCWGAAALLVAAAASLTQAGYRAAPHPATLARGLLLKAADPGEAVSRIMVELPPLDPRMHPSEPNPLTGDLGVKPPAWVTTTDLTLMEYPPANRSLIERDYRRTAVFRSRPLAPWATLGEWGAPYDWKYTHPEITVYRRR